jgi:hypothetical protein
MKVATVFLLALVVASAFAADTDADTDIPTKRPRKGRATKPVKTIGKRYGGQKVHYVPKGDPRARNPNPPVPKPKKTPEPKVIVDAEDVTRWDPPVPKPGPILRGANPAACLANYDGAKVLAKALAYQSAYQSRNTRYSQPNRQFGITAKFADCSSYVTSILADTGYNCLFAAGRYTAFMNQEIRKRGGYSTTARAGDIVMWGGHTGIVTKDCGGGRYQMTAMGNSGARISPCSTLQQLNAWGSGGILGFWHPRP